MVVYSSLFSLLPDFTGPPTDLPDLTSILTSSSVKSKSLTPQPPSSKSKNPKPNLAHCQSPSVALGSPIATKRSTTRGITSSVRSSSLSNIKPPEKRLSTLPNNANYPLPSYLSIASGPTGYLKSSSTSSIPALAAVDESSFHDNTNLEDPLFPFLKPGTPPILVIAGEEKPLDGSLDHQSNATKVEAQVDDQMPTYGTPTEKVTLRKIKTANSSSQSENGIEAKTKAVDEIASSYDFSSSSAASLPSSSFNFKPISSKENITKEFLKNEIMSASSSVTCDNNTISKYSFVAPIPNSAVENPSVLLDALSSSDRVVTNTCQTILNDTSCLKHDKITGLFNAVHDKTYQYHESKCANSPLEPSIHMSSKMSNNNQNKLFSKCEVEPLKLTNNQTPDNISQPKGLNSPIRFAKVIDLKKHEPVTHFASAYVLSPKVDKTVHKFNFEDDANVRIVLDSESELVSEGEFDSFVSEIQRSFTATPVILDSISIDDLQPPEFFRSVSRNDDKHEDADIILSDFDDTYEEHDGITANVYQKQRLPSQTCTVSKPKVMNRDSACPVNMTLKQKAVSNLGMLSTLSAMSKSSEEIFVNNDVKLSNGNVFESYSLQDMSDIVNNQQVVKDTSTLFIKADNKKSHSASEKSYCADQVSKSTEHKKSIRSHFVKPANANVTYQESERNFDRAEMVSSVETKESEISSQTNFQSSKINNDHAMKSFEPTQQNQEIVQNKYEHVENSNEPHSDVNTAVNEHTSRLFTKSAIESFGMYLNHFDREKSESEKSVSKTFMTEFSEDEDSTLPAKLINNYTKEGVFNENLYAENAQDVHDISIIGGDLNVTYLAEDEKSGAKFDVESEIIHEAIIHEPLVALNPVTKVNPMEERPSQDKNENQTIDRIDDDAQSLILQSEALRAEIQLEIPTMLNNYERTETFVETTKPKTNITTPQQSTTLASSSECSSNNTLPALLSESVGVASDAVGGGTGLIYKAEVKVVQQPSTPSHQQPTFLPNGQYTRVNFPNEVSLPVLKY